MNILALIILALISLVAPAPSDAGRGFGTTSGTASTDVITTGTYATSQNRTVCAWFYVNTYDATQRRMVNHVNGAQTLTDLTADSTTHLRFVAGWASDGVWSVTEPSAAAWHHVCVTYNGGSFNNDPIFYLDGATPAVTETSTPSPAIDLTGTVAYLFGNRGAGDRGFNGKLAEIAEWSSVLTAGNIASLWNSGAGARADSIGVSPVFYFTLCGTASPEPDEMGGTAATVTGALGTDHPFSNCAAASSRKSLMLLGVGS